MPLPSCEGPLCFAPAWWLLVILGKHPPPVTQGLEAWLVCLGPELRPQVLAGSWADVGPNSRPLSQRSAHSHGTGRVAGVTALHILHLAGVHVWDRHLLELLHLVWKEGHTEGQGWASSSASVPKGLVAVQARKDTWLPGWKATFLGFLTASWTGPGVRGPGAAVSARAGNQDKLSQEKPGLCA